MIIKKNCITIHLLALLFALVGIWLLVLFDGRSSCVSAAVTVTVDANRRANIGNNIGLPGGTRRSYTIKNTFFGLSIEFQSMRYFLDLTTQRPRVWFQQLLQNFKDYSGTSPIIRIGGKTGDQSWYNPTGLPKPPFVTYDVTPAWILSVRNLANALGTKFIILTNFIRADSSKYSVDFIKALRDMLGWSNVRGIQVGNEPDLYGGRYRPAPYTYAQYKIEQARYIADIKAADPTIPNLFAGGSFCCGFLQNLPDLINTMSDLYSSYGYHLYPLAACGASPTVAQLLDEARVGFLTNGPLYKDIAKAADQRDRDWSLSETNSVICDGFPGTSDTFGAAIWALDWLFTASTMGASGVFFHMSGISSYSPWIINPNNLGANPQIKPIYYAMLSWTYTIRGGATLLSPTVSSTSPGVKVWSVIDNTSGSIKIVLIHKNIAPSGPVPVSITIAQAGSYNGFGDMVVMSAPSMFEMNNVRFAGLSFTGTSNGRPISGTFTSTRVNAIGGVFSVSLAPFSAAILTISKGGGAPPPPPSPSPSPSPSPTPSPPPSSFSPIRVNAGGPLYVDSRGLTWQADNAASSTSSISVVPVAILGTTDPTIYHSKRYQKLGDLVYSFPVTKDIFTVRLHFAETYVGTQAVGKRIFNVLINGVPQFPNLDVFAQAGANTALVKTTTIDTRTATTPRIEIRMQHVVENPFISGIEITRAAP